MYSFLQAKDLSTNYLKIILIYRSLPIESRTFGLSLIGSCFPRNGSHLKATVPSVMRWSYSTLGPCWWFSDIITSGWDSLSKFKPFLQISGNYGIKISNTLLNLRNKLVGVLPGYCKLSSFIIIMQTYVLVILLLCRNINSYFIVV